MTILAGKVSARVAYRDLDVVARALTARFPHRVAEAQRIERMRPLLDSAAELLRTLAAHTQHGMVDCQGSHGTSDLVADTAELSAALDRWSEHVHLVAAEYHYLLSPPAVQTHSGYLATQQLQGSE